MTAPVFVDTNVFLYARDPAEKRKQPLAAAWLERLWVEQSGRTSMQVLSEYYVNLTGKLDPGLSQDEAWADVEMLLAWNPLAIDRPVLEEGREIQRRYRLNWWDCLVVAAAHRQDCALLLTEDLQDGTVVAGIAVRSPFTLSVDEAKATYLPAPRIASRHPSRGRPRATAIG